MKIFKRADQIQDYLSNLRKTGKTIAFAPTMGALHIGHMSLLSQANEKADISLVSIFVNPTQFNDPKDLEKYPRPISSDLELLIENHCDILFLPPEKEVYPKNAGLLNYDIGYPGEVLEGKYREGHFQGVVTVVKRLLDICNPSYLLMGQKDFQQQLIIRRMIAHFNLPTELVTCPIVREADGLAFSSRNVRLHPEFRDVASCLFSSLLWVKNHMQDFDVETLTNQATNQINSAGLIVEYYHIIHGDTLELIDEIKDQSSIVAVVAAYAGEVRLIDNMILRE